MKEPTNLPKWNIMIILFFAGVLFGHQLSVETHSTSHTQGLPPLQPHRLYYILERTTTSQDTKPINHVYLLEPEHSKCRVFASPIRKVQLGNQQALRIEVQQLAFILKHYNTHFFRKAKHLDNSNVEIPPICPQNPKVIYGT
ncbi:MAG: hypothetical protein OXT67_09235 [Zetaproteobacteria bacterium]|nr:hypothetical protein [Zetaproteobacteria bacterium]